MHSRCKITVALFGGCLTLISGCATTRHDHVEIISEPPGAKIEVDNEFVGVTPYSGDIKRTSAPFGPWRSAQVNAYPAAAGQCTQSKLIEQRQDTPSRMYFDMTLCKRVPTSYDINVTNDKK
jgi:hypothetical protein